MVVGPQVPEFPKDRRRRELIEELRLQEKNRLIAQGERRKATREWVALVLSSLAFAVSILAWWTSHKDAKESLRQSQRAYVQLLPRYENGQALIDVSVVGPTPAKNVRLDAECLGADIDAMTPSFRFQHPPKFQTFFRNTAVFPGSPRTTACPLFEHTPKNILIRAEANYTDIFDVKRTTKLCLAYFLSLQQTVKIGTAAGFCPDDTNSAD